MRVYHAVKCKTCQEPIKLDEPFTKKPGELAVGIPPLHPVPCEECGSSYEYDSDDVIELEED
jgi:hypothetical protein